MLQNSVGKKAKYGFEPVKSKNKRLVPFSETAFTPEKKKNRILVARIVNDISETAAKTELEFFH